MHHPAVTGVIKDPREKTRNPSASPTRRIPTIRRSWFLAYPGYQVLVCRRWNNQFKLAEWNTARYTRAAREREREIQRREDGYGTIDRRAKRCRRGTIWRRESYPVLGFVGPIRWNSSANIMSFVRRGRASLVTLTSRCATGRVFSLPILINTRDRRKYIKETERGSRNFLERENDNDRRNQ